MTYWQATLSWQLLCTLQEQPPDFLVRGRRNDLFYETQPYQVPSHYQGQSRRSHHSRWWYLHHRVSWGEPARIHSPDWSGWWRFAYWCLSSWRHRFGEKKSSFRTWCSRLQVFGLQEVFSSCGNWKRAGWCQGHVFERGWWWMGACQIDELLALLSFIGHLRQWGWILGGEMQTAGLGPYLCNR